LDDAAGSVPFIEIFRRGLKKIGARRQFYNKYFPQGNLKLRHIGIDSDQKIIISENLTKANQAIFAAAMHIKKEENIKSVSIANGTVHVKQKEGDKRVPIQKVAELEWY
jgi:hypothetical protein